MDNNEKAQTKTATNITVGLVLGWVFGVLFIIASLGAFPTSALGGLALLFAGLILIPPVNTAIATKLNFSLSGGIRTVISITLIVIGLSTLPSEVAEDVVSSSSTETPIADVSENENEPESIETEVASVEQATEITTTPVAQTNTPVVATNEPVSAAEEPQAVQEAAPTPSNPRADALAVLKANAAREWGDDYQMVQFEYNNQVEAYDWVTRQTAQPTIMARAKQEWDDDYQMVKFEYENQLEAYNWLNAQTQYPDIMERARREWGDDYQMVKFEYENQVEAFTGL
jgi:hypothetical protein